MEVRYTQLHLSGGPQKNPTYCHKYQDAKLNRSSLELLTPMKGYYIMLYCFVIIDNACMRSTANARYPDGLMSTNARWRPGIETWTHNRGTEHNIN